MKKLDELGLVAGSYPSRREGKLAAEVVDAHSADVSGCAVGLIGLADDEGVGLNNGRIGARYGPVAFRAALAGYGVAQRMGTGEALPRVADFGDIEPGGDIHETHERVSAAVEHIAGLGLVPVGIGGGHDLTYAFVRGVWRAMQGAGDAELGGGMDGVYLDAHLDVRAEVGSGMPFRKLIEEGIVRSLRCIGLDRFANSHEHYAWFKANGGSDEWIEPAAWAGLENGPMFVSIDLDAINVSQAPGVSAINAGGLTGQQAAEWANAAGRNRSVRCFDIMELCPNYDDGGKTARLAARLFLEFLDGLARRER